MKASLILFLSFFLINFSSKAHDKIVFKTKESFNQSCETGKYCSNFDLIKLESETHLNTTEQFIENNSSILKWTLKDTKVKLEVTSDKPEKVYYQKLFQTMGLHEVEIQNGKYKGVYSVEDFLNLYEF